jgi:[acyl-carrier-protein] S-malonyltransferase
MSLAILCPGQGSQHARMFDGLRDNELARPILDKVAGLTGLDLDDLGSAEASGLLAQNRIAQILVVGHSLAFHATLPGFPGTGLVVAGYSVGDLTAHALAGALSVDDALSLAKARGEAMDRAVLKSGVALGMTGVRGISVPSMETMIANTGVEIALVNGRDHVVVGGPLIGLDEIESRALATGAHIKRLGVTVASHTSYMQDAAIEFEKALQQIAWKRPAHRLLSPVDGASVMTRERAINALAQQICVRLDWESTMQALREYGVVATLELGAGRALSAMIDESFPDIVTRCAEDFKTSIGLAQWISKHAT